MAGDPFSFQSMTCLKFELWFRCNSEFMAKSKLSYLNVMISHFSRTITTSPNCCLMLDRCELLGYPLYSFLHRS